jgi:hypothetical protein
VISSNHIPEIRVLVAQIGDLFRCPVLKSVVSLSLSAQLIFSHVPENAEESEAEHNDLHAQVDGVPDVIGGSVVDEVRPAVHH